MQVETSSENRGLLAWIERRGVAETLACALAFLAYVPTLGFQFVYDDKPQVLQNPAIHAWRYIPHYFTSHVWGELYPNVQGDYYRPLFLLWFRINHAMFGIDPQGWHFTTILCHVAVTYLVFVLVRRLTGTHGIAFSAATLFALHPVHIESVAWVSGVSDPLTALSLIGSFLAYLRFRQENRWGWMGLALTLFALGLLEKETTVVLGPLVFTYAWIYAERTSWISRFACALKHSLSFFVLTILYLLLRAHILHGLSHSVTPLSWKSMALTEPSILWLYLRHLLFPMGISGLYGLPYINYPASTAFVVPAILLVVLLGALAWGIRKLDDPRLALFACCWIALPIIPVLWLRTFSEGDIAHDRYLYIPSIGFVLVMSLGLARISNLWGASQKTLELAGLAMLAVAYALGTVTQQTYWASDLLLYQRAFTIAPHDNLVCTNLGSALLDAGDPEAAIALYSQVLAREPSYWLSNYDLGYTYYKLGKPQAAETYLRRALSVNDKDSDTLICLGLCIWRQGRADEAIPYVQRAIQARPSALGYHFALAMILREQNNIAAAEYEFKQELWYNPQSTAARQQLDALTSGAAGSK
jgi:tetratricopeptide (TPR) repeat protein